MNWTKHYGGYEVVTERLFLWVKQHRSGWGWSVSLNHVPKKGIDQIDGRARSMRAAKAQAERAAALLGETLT